MEFKDFIKLSTNFKNNFSHEILKLVFKVASKDFIERNFKKKRQN